MVPPMDAEPWPTLGPQVCAWMEGYLVFGPGDLRGTEYKLDDEKRALLYRIYEVYPKNHPQAGRRRFKRVGLSLRKGTAKTEFAAATAAAELHQEGPVRCDGFDAKGQPVGVPIRDPYIPMIAYTEEQSDELAYGALLVMISEGPLANDFDIGLERIMRKGGDGKAVSLATAPDARDGARTTFQLFDETHRLVLPRQREAHQTMLFNIPKRRLADAWSLETTTAYTPGEGSVAEGTMDYARQVAEGKLTEPRLFFFHRQSGDEHNLTTEVGVRAAVLEASGPTAEWSDIDGIVELWRDPNTDRNLWERLWCNRPTRTAAQAFSVTRWQELAIERTEPEDGATITLGFDGSRSHATALVGTEVTSGFQWLLGLWERPEGQLEWTVPVQEVDDAVDAAFERWNVWRLYANPAGWETKVSEWAGRHGDDRVIEWFTVRQRPMAYALRAFSGAITAGEGRHSGDSRLTAHLGNAQRRHLNILDDDRKPLWLIQKERPDSVHRIDAAMAAVLSWEARTDAVAEGVGDERSIYETEDLLVL